MPELSDDVKRQALEATRNIKVEAEISALPADKERATMPNQPQLDPDVAGRDVSKVPDWRDTQAMDAMREQKRDMNAPGE